MQNLSECGYLVSLSPYFVLYPVRIAATVISATCNTTTLQNQVHENIIDKKLFRLLTLLFLVPLSQFYSLRLHDGNKMNEM